MAWKEPSWRQQSLTDDSFRVSPAKDVSMASYRFYKDFSVGLARMVRFGVKRYEREYGNGPHAIYILLTLFKNNIKHTVTTFTLDEFALLHAFFSSEELDVVLNAVAEGRDAQMAADDLIPQAQHMPMDQLDEDTAPAQAPPRKRYRVL